MKGRWSKVRAITVAPDGRFVVTCDGDGANDGQCRFRLGGCLDTLELFCLAP